jgi:hypothetical protein
LIGRRTDFSDTDFPHLDTETVFASLEKVTFDHFFIDEPFINFVVDRSPNLNHLKLFACVAGTLDGGMSDVEDPPTWAQLFTRLTTGALNLHSLTIRHKYTERRLLDIFERTAEPQDDIRSAYIALDLQDSDRQIMTTNEWTRRKRILPHSYLDDKYGMFFCSEEENASRFLQGEDHRALLELWDAMESRGGEGVVYLDPLSDPRHDGEEEDEEEKE